MTMELPNGLQRLGLRKRYEMLLWVPRKYQNYTNVVEAAQLREYIDRRVVLRVLVAGKPVSSERGRFTVPVQDVEGNLYRLLQFGMIRFSPWVDLNVGDVVYLRCEVKEFNDRIHLFKAELVDAQHVGKICPVYSGKPGVVAAAAVGESIREAITDGHAIEDAVTAIRQAFGGESDQSVLARAGTSGTLRLLLMALHNPTTRAMAEWGSRTAKALGVAYLYYHATRTVERPLRVQSVLRITREEIAALVAQLPFAPTSGPRSQLEAIEGIRAELEAPYAMDAVLTADVGVGKTLIYMLPAIAARERGAKVCVLVPNTILGEQICSEFQALYPKMPVALVSEASAKQVDLSTNPIVIATVKIFNLAKKANWVPNLLVIDEQQKLSAEQRSRLCGPDTNVLQATATPTPRTLALIEHGGRTRFEVDKQHAAKIIKTIIARSGDRERMFAALAEVVKAGGQAAVIYPRVKSSGERDAKSVLAAAERFERIAPGRIAVIHGKLSAVEKVEAMRQAKAGEKSIIVASSIIEIGVTIANLRLLIVVEADRYGTSTLHQMRGRLVRNGGEGVFYAYLPEDEVEDETMQRIELLSRTNNGFELAELDMAQRGFGDLSGEDADESGKSRTLFRGLMLMPDDLTRAEAACAA